MTSILNADFDPDCKSCLFYQDNSTENPVLVGQSIFRGEVYQWEVVESRRKTAPIHYIFTTTSHHIGEDKIDERVFLLKTAYYIAVNLFDDHNFQIKINTGKRISHLDHFHVHMRNEN